MKHGWAPDRRTPFRDIEALRHSLVFAIGRIRARGGRESKQQQKQLTALYYRRVKYPEAQ